MNSRKSVHTLISLLFLFYSSFVIADDNRYEITKKGVVLDRFTGLMWKACAEGQKWEDGACRGELLRVDNNKKSNSGYIYAGFDDWRVPSSYELESLVICKNPLTKKINFKGQYDECNGDYIIPTIDKYYFPSTKPIRYWSSTIVERGFAESISFRSGVKYISNVNDKYALRLVRGY